MDLTDVQSLLELHSFSLHLFSGRSTAVTDCVESFFLPALCIITTLVYFFPRKVRRSAPSSLNSLSHSPEKKKGGFKYDVLHVGGLHGGGQNQSNGLKK